MDLAFAYPLPNRAETPIISSIDLEGPGEGERLILLVIQQAPDVHFAATAEKLAQRLAGDEAFVAEADPAAFREAWASECGRDIWSLSNSLRA